MAKTKSFVEEVELQGHIIDSLLLPKVLDEILTRGGTYVMKEIKLGKRQIDPSYTRIEIKADSQEQLNEILAAIHEHGAVSTTPRDCEYELADMDGAFPDRFYSTTNYRTQIRLGNDWIDVDDQEMDCGIVLDLDKKTARTLPMAHVKRGDPIVVGHHGVRVMPAETTARHSLFEFMSSAVSSEKPKGVTVREIAAAMKRAKAGREKILAVLGPAVVHTGSVEHICELIRIGHARCPVRRQRPGHPRHRTGPVRHQPGRLARPRPARRGRPRTPSPRHQHHSPARRHPGGSRQGHPQERHHVRVHPAQDPLRPRRQNRQAPTPSAATVANG